ncbi:DnaB-like helicase C-terminal domain-containing protein [Larkinella bovis]|uniref:DnaB-like helicase C-terminal domain-containing protein n=1 Tax=Larkinella bovis TaxID=683041 RepID=A0ABW0IDV1_9BACT
MSNRSATEIAEQEIYPALFEVMDRALPEFGFVRFNKGWQSTTGVKIDGSEGKDGKVAVLADIPNRLCDFTKGSKSIWDYLRDRDSLSDGEAFRLMAQLAGVSLNGPALNEEDAQRQAAFRRKVQLWEDLNEFFIDCLHNSGNPHNKSTRAQLIITYLVDKRGYNTEYFLRRAKSYSDKDHPKMEAGLVPPKESIEAFLRERGYTESEILNLFANNKTLGRTHFLSFPYRDSVGRARGMVFRSTTGEEPKYMYSQGLDRNNILFNLKPIRQNKDLVIVEGVLDALHCSAVGIENVAAIGGSLLSQAQIEIAIQGKAKRITLMLDNDSAGRTGTLKALDLLLKYPDVKPFVAILPEGNDPDDVLRSSGPQRLQQIIDQATPGYVYRFYLIVAKYGDIQEANGGRDLTPKEIDSMLEEIAELSRLVTDPIERDLFLKVVEKEPGLQDLGISHEALKEKTDQLHFNKLQLEQTQAITDLLGRIKNKQATGDVQGTIEALAKGVQEIRAKNLQVEFSELVIPTAESEFGARLKVKPNNLKTGYIIDGEELQFPAGAVSLICAPTNHGKTTFLINSLLKVAKADPAKSFYLFSYEEDADSVTITTLSTFIGKKISNNNRESIRSYYREEGEDKLKYIERESRDLFLQYKDHFFKDYINTGRLAIRYTEFESGALADSIRYLAKHGNAGGIFIDYMQLLRKEKFKNGPRAEELKQVCLDLKNAAIDTGLPVIICAQYNRQVTNPFRMHNTLIADASDIEKIANCIVGFWNLHKKALGTEKELEDVAALAQYGDLYVEVTKFRGGRTTGVGKGELLLFDGNTGVIKNRAFHDQSTPHVNGHILTMGTSEKVDDDYGF